MNLTAVRSEFDTFLHFHSACNRSDTREKLNKICSLCARGCENTSKRHKTDLCRNVTKNWKHCKQHCKATSTGQPKVRECLHSFEPSSCANAALILITPPLLIPNN